MLTFEQFQTNVQEWSTARGIYEHSTTGAQLMKALSELGELADAIIKHDMDGFKDAVGDVAVCLVNYAKMQNLEFGNDTPFEVKKYTVHRMVGMLSGSIGDRLINISSAHAPVENVIHLLDVIANRHGFNFLDCCTAAWNEIKDRKGHMVAGGAFVKDE